MHVYATPSTLVLAGAETEIALPEPRTTYTPASSSSISGLSLRTSTRSVSDERPVAPKKRHQSISLLYLTSAGVSSRLYQRAE